MRVSLSAGARMPSNRPLALAALAIALAGVLAGCQRTPSPAQGAALADPAAATGAAPAASGSDLAGIDKSVAPGDDFNAYANGSWEKTAQIPDDRSSTGVFVQVF